MAPWEVAHVKEQMCDYDQMDEILDVLLRKKDDVDFRIFAGLLDECRCVLLGSGVADDGRGNGSRGRRPGGGCSCGRPLRWRPAAPQHHQAQRLLPLP